MLSIGGVKLPPGPIEDEIKRLPNVRDAVLLTHTEDTADARLIDAVELEASGPADALRALVAPLVTRYLPMFALLAFPSFPRTKNGEIRRTELETAVRRRMQ